MLKLPNHCSIYTAEALAISHALDIIKQDTIKKSIIILSDSLSTLTSIKNFFQPNSISQKIQNQISYLQCTDYHPYMDTNSYWNPWKRVSRYMCQTVHIASPHSLALCSHTLQDSKYFITEYILKNWQYTWSNLRTKLN